MSFPEKNITLDGFTKTLSPYVKVSEGLVEITCLPSKVLPGNAITDDVFQSPLSCFLTGTSVVIFVIIGLSTPLPFSNANVLIGEVI